MNRATSPHGHCSTQIDRVQDKADSQDRIARILAKAYTPLEQGTSVCQGDQTLPLGLHP